MKAVVQRVSSARVQVGDQAVGEIGRGLLFYLGVANGDGPEQVAWLAENIVNLRIFDHDSTAQPNDLQPNPQTSVDLKTSLSALDIAGEALVISQFIQLADTRKSRRFSFSQAADRIGGYPISCFPGSGGCLGPCADWRVWSRYVGNE